MADCSPAHPKPSLPTVEDIVYSQEGSHSRLIFASFQTKQTFAACSRTLNDAECKLHSSNHRQGSFGVGSNLTVLYVSRCGRLYDVLEAEAL
jgi:hypothetical protein